MHLLPTNRSRCSDKSSDSGGVLDLSSRVAGDSKGEESWLFEMETKMKGTLVYSSTVFVSYYVHVYTCFDINSCRWKGGC